MTHSAARVTAEPYVGLRPYRLADSDRFFGRSSESGMLAELWLANRLTIVTGPVASGKTSLLRAGVRPLVATAGVDVLPPGRLSCYATFPSAALPPHNPYTLALLRSWCPGETAARLAGLSVLDFVRRYAGRHGGIILGAIDHVEDLPAHPSHRQVMARQFLRELGEAAQAEGPRLHLLLLIRADRVGLLTPELSGGVPYQVLPLTRQGALEAVARPVRGTGREMTDSAAEKLVADLVTRHVVADGRARKVTVDYVEPALLQAVCMRLWRELPADMERITVREVRAYGNADTALATHCARAVAVAADDHDLSPAWLRSWLLDTFITEHGARARVPEGAVSTAKVANAVLRSLADRQLLSAASAADGARSYELLSDRLIEPLRNAADELRPPADPGRYLRAGERALALGELDLAARYAERCFRTAPQNDYRLRAETLSLLGNISHEQEVPRQAEELYSEAARLFEAVRDVAAVACELAAAGETQLAQGRIAEAVSTLRAAVSRLPNDAVHQTRLARALWQLGEGRAAVAVLTAALGTDPGNVEALLARGEILADLGEAQHAMIDLDRVLGPQRVTLHHRPAARAARGLALAQLGDNAAARQELEGASAEDQWNGPVLYYAARAFALTGDHATARELARRASIATDPALPPPHRDIARQLGDSLTA